MTEQRPRRRRATASQSRKPQRKRTPQLAKEPLSPEIRAVLEEATRRAERVTVDTLAREMSAQRLEQVRAERDGYAYHNGALQLLTPADLSKNVVPVSWLIRGVWGDGEFGPFGGAKKTLKTWCAMIHTFAIAAGVPSFGHPAWEVSNPRPVLYICGEGGENLVKRRFQRIADMYGVSVEDVPVYVVVGVASFNSEKFRRQIAQHVHHISDLQGEMPGLVVLDSLYNFHPADVEVANLYGRGPMLAGLQQWVKAVTSGEFQVDGAALWIIDHFNKSGSGTDLDRYGQSGMNAFAGAWWNAELLSAEPELGDFVVGVEVGSREGFSARYTIRVNLGQFDITTGAYEDALSVTVIEGTDKSLVAAQNMKVKAATQTEITRALCELLTASPYTHKKDQAIEQVARGLGTTAPRVRSAWRRTEERGHLKSERRPVEEGSRRVRRPVWAWVGGGDG